MFMNVCLRVCMCACLCVCVDVYIQPYWVRKSGLPILRHRWSFFKTKLGAVVCHFSVFPLVFRSFTVSLNASLYVHFIPVRTK